MYNVSSTLSSFFWPSTFPSQDVYSSLSTFSLPQLIKAFFGFFSMPSADHMSSQTISSEHNKNQVDVNYYLGVYILLGFLIALFGSIRSYYMSMGSLVASRKLHEAILEKVMKAKIRFFDTTPIGIYSLFVLALACHNIHCFLYFGNRTHIEPIFKRYGSY